MVSALNVEKWVKQSLNNLFTILNESQKICKESKEAWREGKAEGSGTMQVEDPEGTLLQFGDMSAQSAIMRLGL